MVRIMRQMKMVARPRICRWGPAAMAASCRLGRISRIMGVDSTERPTPAGIASTAMIRKAEEIMRSALAVSRWAMAAAAKGIRLMVTG